MKGRAAALAGLGCVLAAAPLACKMTPAEIQRIQVENELLRREIQVIRQNCDYYGRTLELEVDPQAPAGEHGGPGGAAPATEGSDAPGEAVPGGARPQRSE